MTTPARSSSLAWLALLGSGLLYGYNWVVMKSALRYEAPATFAASRVFGGAVFLFLLLVVLRRPLRPTNWRLTVVVGLFGMAGAIGLTIWALSTGDAGKTSVLFYTMPVWLLLMSWTILGERVRGLQWISVGLALVGMILIISPWNPQGTGLSTLLGVAAGVCSAASAVAAKLLFRRDQRVDLLSLNAWQMLFGALPLLAIAFATSSPAEMFSTSPWYIISLLYNVIFVCGISLLLWFYTLRNLSAGTAGMGRLIAPVIGLVAAWIQLGEHPDRYEAAGSILIIAGLCALAAQQLLAERRTGRKAAAAGAAPVAADATAPRAVIEATLPDPDTAGAERALAGDLQVRP
jgi:drug/metabolite transporter (DMT)-like permease